jgi:hypothetical protein
MDLHSKALRYLQRNTKRCITCGELNFIKLIDKTEPEVKQRRPTMKLSQVPQLEEAMYSLEDEGIIYLKPTYCKISDVKISDVKKDYYFYIVILYVYIIL